MQLLIYSGGGGGLIYYYKGRKSAGKGNCDSIRLNLGVYCTNDRR